MSLKDELCEQIEQKKDLIEARKEVVTRTWAYHSVDHIPVLFSVDWLPWPKTYREEFENGQIQRRNRMYSIRQSLEMIPDDYIPTAFIDVGCVGLAESFGGEIFLGDDPGQTPGIIKPVITTPQELELRLGEGLTPNFTRGLAAEYLLRLNAFIEETDERVYVSGMDLNGPMGVAMDLLGSKLLFELLLDENPLLFGLLETITGAICDFTDLAVKRAGTVERFTSLDYFWYWCPVKGHVSSDLSAMYSGRYFDLIERTYLERILETYGGGLLHNCGPNPCTENYAAMNDLRGLNVSYRYSKNDLPRFRRHLSGRVVYFFMDDNDEYGSIDDFRHIMDELAPEVIGIPIVSCLNPTLNIPSLYRQYRTVATEYARRVFG
ncbi:MAG TPA: hypothetical protein VLH40_00785 [Atribacteraceae bacterium]|nr:hypothetical protein [Atribacteraceae bacterium]